MRMIDYTKAGYISVIQFVMCAWFGPSMLMAFISGLLTTFVLYLFSDDIEFNDSSDKQGNKDTENDEETAKTREELKNK
jgi:hypothetical protein